MKKFFGLMVAAAALVLGVACDTVEVGSTSATDSSLVVELSKSIILANGEDAATIKVWYKGEDVTAESTVYNVSDNRMNADLSTTFTYTSSTVGKYSFYVSYLTYNTKENPSSITALNEVPGSMKDEDSDAQNTSFLHRSMLIRYTGTQCPNCPYMEKALEALVEDANYTDKVNIASIHSYSDADPLNVKSPGAALVSSYWLGISSYPSLVIDLMRKNGYVVAEGAGASTSYFAGVYKDHIDTLHETPAKAGIAANVLVGEDGLVVVQATVKAGANGEYRVGGWLLENGLYAEQSVAAGVTGDFDTHNNVVHIVDSKYDGTYDYTGHGLGSMQAGSYVDYVFSFETSDISLKLSTGTTGVNLDNCHILLFVTTKNAKGEIYITNSVKVPAKTGKYGFEYNN